MPRELPGAREQMLFFDSEDRGIGVVPGVE